MNRYLALVLLMAMCSSCQKKYDARGSAPLAGQWWYRDLDIPAKTEMINVATGGSFRGLSGARYVFPPNAFADANGNIPAGNVFVAVREMAKKHDIMYAGAGTKCMDAPFVCDGMVDVTVSGSLNGLHMAPGKTYEVYLPQIMTPVKNTFLMSGTHYSYDSVDFYDHIVHWDPVSASGNAGYIPDTTIIKCDTLGLVCAGQFFSSPNYQHITVRGRIDGQVVMQQGEWLSCYAIYDNSNVVWPMKHTAYMEFLDDRILHVAMHFVMICQRNDKLYAGILAATATDQEVYIIDLQLVTREELKAMTDTL